MKVRAVAYHESIAMEKLEKYFEGQQGDVAGTSARKCSHCNQVFAIPLPSRDPPDNPRYVLRLTRLISDHCEDGAHPQEYVLDVSSGSPS